jgi:hypothetical protein
VRLKLFVVSPADQRSQCSTTMAKACADCEEIVSCLINHLPSTSNHRIQQIICVCCNGEITTFHSRNAASKQKYGAEAIR